ncbi:MAG: hypothetical protein JW854_02475, partial [Actinobacteria bacterium]|nr:hypothetical protein [Actinomycetota bacterium]
MKKRAIKTRSPASIRIGAIAVMALSFLLAASVCLAGVRWKPNGVALRGAGVANDAYNPRIASDGSGGAIVTWMDDRSGSQWEIYAQRVDSSGTPQWTPDGVPLRGTGEADSADDPCITSDGSGGAIVAWMDFRSESQFDIYAQRVDSSGTPQWTPNGVMLRGTGEANDASNPCIISDGSGGAIVAWEDNRNGLDDIYAQRVDPSGTPQWTTNGVELRGTGVANAAENPCITSDGSGGAIVGWRDYRSISRWDIYAQRVDSSGITQWTDNGVELRGTGVANNASSPRITSDGSGGAIVAWSDLRSGSKYEIYARRVDSSGNPQWTDNGVELRGTGVASSAGNPRISTDGSGGAIVAWNDNRSGKEDIYARRVDSSGNPQWTDEGVELRGTGVAKNASSPCITSDGSGGAIVAWM